MTTSTTPLTPDVPGVRNLELDPHHHWVWTGWRDRTPIRVLVIDGLRLPLAPVRAAIEGLIEATRHRFAETIYGVHELAESGVIQGTQSLHDATERFGPDGDIGHLIAYSLVLAPILYLLWARPRASAAA